MRIALIGQAAFGEAVFRALREAGEEIVAVSSVEGTPERPDPLWAAALAAGLPRFPTGKLKKPDVLDTYSATQPDLCIMAFVNHILPQRVLDAPPLGSIQYHPSLLPRHRGRSAINWALRMGDSVTGITIFWVDAGIDTGPILLQKQVEIGPDDTVGSLYFDRLFPLGVEALVASARLVREDTAPRVTQDESRATYEAPADDTNSAIDWTLPAQQIYDLIRGSNPQPGAHAMLRGQQVRIFDARLTLDAAQTAPPGTMLALHDDRIEIALAGGALHAQRLQLAGGKKLSAADFAAQVGVAVGDAFADGASS
jgi:methionyl-tRNA formyltransferase